MIPLRKLAGGGPTDKTITLGWDPVPGVEGWRFYSQGILRSKTCDASRRSVKFANHQEPYRVEAVVMAPIDSGTYPSESIQELGRNVMFTAQNPIAAVRCPAHWKVALSADPAYDAAARAAAPVLRQRGLRVAVWGVQTQIGVDRIRRFGQEIGADFTILQAETAEEYRTAVEAGAVMVVGNPNAWTPEQRQQAIVAGDRFTTMFEVYSNEGQPWPDTASSQGVPVCCEVLGVGFGKIPYQLADYRPHTPAGVWETMSVYYAETLNDESWGLLP